MAGSGYQRLIDLREEIECILKKREIADQNGAAGEDIEELNGLLAGLREAFAEAALIEAAREVEDAMDEAKRIGDGRPRKPDPDDARAGNPDTGKKKDDDDDGDGGGRGIGSNSSGMVPDPTCIYVRGDKTVWAWSRPDQDWIPFTTGDDLVEVEFVDGGILLVARDGAAIFDCVLGRWLTALQAGEELIEGDSAS